MNPLRRNSALVVSIGFGLLLGGCAEQPPSIPIADLPAAKLPASEIRLLPASLPVNSTEPLHNFVPPHGGTITSRITDNFETNCVHVRGTEICDENYFVNEGLILSAKGLSGKNATLDFPPTISGVLGRFLGAPVATLYLIVEFSEDRLGLLHSYGFTLLKSGRFCKTVRTNPNHALSYGVSADGRHALLFSAGRASSVDRAVEGWRSLDESLLCGA